MADEIYIYMNIKILGARCAKCETLEKVTRKAVAEIGIVAEIEKVEDLFRIVGFGVMQTPALVINEKVVSNGRIPSYREIKELLLKSMEI
jgi:small redox-active disulfide protein 2